MGTEIVDNEKQCDKIFLKKVNELIEIFDWIDHEIENTAERTSKIDSESSDWLHLIENNRLTDKESVRVVKILHELREKRRSVKNEYFLLNVYKENKMKLIHQAQREMFKNEMTTKWHELNMPYRNRIITKYDINEVIINDETTTKEVLKEDVPKKRGRKPKEFLTARDGTEYSSTELKQMLLEVGTQRKLAEKINVGQPALSLFLRKHGVKTYSKRRKKKGEKQ